MVAELTVRHFPSILLMLLLLSSSLASISHNKNGGDKNDDNDDVIGGGSGRAKGRELATLGEKWFLADNGVEFEGLGFSLGYVTSDYVVESMMEATAYTTECKDGGGVTIPNDDMAVTIVVPDDETEQGAGDQVRSVSVDIAVVNTGESSLETSMAYNEVTNENGETVASIKFCMRFGLFVNGNSDGEGGTSSPIEVNFIETIVEATFDLTSGFSIEGVDVTQKDLVTATAFQEYQLDAYQCKISDGSDYEPLTTEELTASSTQGSISRVCIQPDQDAREQGVVMKSINSFTYNRDYGPSSPVGAVTQPAVENGLAASNALSELVCIPGASVCSVETVLFSNFYLSPGSVTASGIASLQFAASDESNRSRRQQRRILSRKRHQEQSSSRRAMQQQENDGTTTNALFDLDFDLVPQESFTDRHQNIFFPYSSSSPTLTRGGGMSSASSFVIAAITMTIWLW